MTKREKADTGKRTTKTEPKKSFGDFSAEQVFTGRCRNTETDSVPEKTYISYRESLKVFVKYLSVHFMLSVSSQAKKQHVLSGGTWTDNVLHSAPSRWHFFLPAKNWREWFLLRSEILAFRMSERGKKVIPYKNRCWVELSKATAATKKLNLGLKLKPRKLNKKLKKPRGKKIWCGKKQNAHLKGGFAFSFGRQLDLYLDDTTRTDWFSRELGSASFVLAKN